MSFVFIVGENIRDTLYDCYAGTCVMVTSIKNWHGKTKEQLFNFI